MTASLVTTSPINRLFVERVMLGEVAGWSHVRKFGAALDIGTSIVPVTTSKTYQTPTTAQALEIVSDDNTNDVSDGDGARTVTVIGLDENWLEQTETVTLNGTTAVDLANTYTRIYRMFVSTSGTYGTASGSSHDSTITLRGDGGGATWAVIDSTGGLGLGQSLISAYTIPAGKRGWLTGRSLTVETSKSVSLLGLAREAADTVAAPFSPMRIFELDRGAISADVKRYPVPLPFVGPCDIGFMAAATATTASVSVNFDLLLEDV